MADNIGYTPGEGATVAADEIDGALHQRVKIGIGPDGTAVDVSQDNPMPVAIAGVSEEDPLPVHDEAAHQLLVRLMQYLNAPQGYDKSLQRARVTAVLESGTLTTLTTVTTVSSVTNIAAVGGYSAQMQIMDTNRTAWAQCVRARIT